MFLFLRYNYKNKTCKELYTRHYVVDRAGTEPGDIKKILQCCQWYFGNVNVILSKVSRKRFRSSFNIWKDSELL